MTEPSAAQRIASQQAPPLAVALPSRAPTLSFSARRLTLAVRALGLALVLQAASCSPRRWDVVLPDNLPDAGMADRPGGRGPGGHDGTGGQTGNADGGFVFDAAKDAFPGCGQLTQSPYFLGSKPTVLLLADRSLSTNVKGAGSGDPWWKAENEAITKVLNLYGNTLKIGYLALPGSTACTTDDVVWGADVESQIADCNISGACVASSSSEVPLAAAFNDASKVLGTGFLGQDRDNNYAVVLIGSSPGCTSCPSGSADLHSLSSLNAQTVFVKFGKSLDSNSCFSAFEAAAKARPPLSPTGSAHDTTDLAYSVQSTFKEIASQYLCSFVPQGGSAATVRLQVGSGPTIDVQKDENRQSGWAFTSPYTLRVYGPACQKILDSDNPLSVNATFVDAVCGPQH